MSNPSKDIDKQGSITSILIHGKFTTPRWEYAHPVVPPLSGSTTYRLESAKRGAKGFQDLADPQVSVDDERIPIYIYDRLDEPTRGMLEERLAYAEGGECALTFASGMAAISAAIFTHAKLGDKIIVHKTIYGCTHSLITLWLPRFGIEYELIDLNKLDVFKSKITPNTKVVYLESPCNPTLTLVDIKAVSEIIKEINKKRDEKDRITLIVDNTFATPYCQRPLSLGADLVVHSLTKNISGFGTDMGGVIVTEKNRKLNLFMFRKDFGGVIATKSAWPIMVYGLSTLPLRMAKQQQNSMELAKFLANHPLVEKVSYPGLENFPQKELARRQMLDYEGNFAPGNMLYFVLKGSPEEAKKKGELFIDYLAQHAYSITLAVSLGQIRTLIEHPSSMTHALIPAEDQIKAEIDPGGIRMSIGIEDINDLIYDMDRALDYISKL